MFLFSGLRCETWHHYYILLHYYVFSNCSSGWARNFLHWQITRLKAGVWKPLQLVITFQNNIRDKHGTQRILNSNLIPSCIHLQKKSFWVKVSKLFKTSFNHTRRVILNGFCPSDQDLKQGSFLYCRVTQCYISMALYYFVL